MVETHRIREGDLDAYVDGSSTASYPSVSVVVPVYDDPEGIETTIESVASSEYPDLEMLVVYTPADGETSTVLDDRAERHPWLSVHTETTYRTPGGARNVAIDRADGDVVLFVDADMSLGDRLCWRVAYLFETTDVDYLGFPVEMVVGDRTRTLAGLYDYQVRFPNKQFMDDGYFCPTCSLAVRAEVFESGLRMNPTLTSAEDVMFGHDVSYAGFTHGFSPDLRAFHPIRNSWRAIVAKGVKTGWGYQEVTAQYDGPRSYDRPYPLMADAWIPEPPSSLREICREWDELGPAGKATVFVGAYVEQLARVWGYVRASFGDSEEELPDVIQRAFEHHPTLPHPELSG